MCTTPSETYTIYSEGSTGEAKQGTGANASTEHASRGQGCHSKRHAALSISQLAHACTRCRYKLVEVLKSVQHHTAYVKACAWTLVQT